MRNLLCFLIAMLFSVLIANGQTTRTVGGTGANYATLKSAFDAINAGTVTGTVILQITGSTTETSTAQLNASGTGSASYTSVSIYPTGSGYSISGNLATPLVELNAATNVTIDGRVNAAGSSPDLTIVNQSTSGVSNTSTLTLINSAASNTIKYATIKGGATGIYSGVILFNQSNSGNGCSNNAVDHCNLTSINAASRPYYVIYSYGTTGHENKNNTISNNNIYDFLSTSLNSSYGINVSVSSTDWTITGNSLYETTSLVPTLGPSFFGIKINNTSGNNFVISGNYIGGSAPLCAGAPFTVSANFAYRFYCIHIDAGTTTASSVQNNTIKNFALLGGSDIPFMGIDINSGNVNVGTVTGNTIGDAGSIGSISLSAPVASATLNLVGGVIQNNVVINNGGSGYTSAPNISFTGNGTGATGTATISNGVVTGINITNGGSGYTYGGVTFNSSSSVSISYGIYVQSSGNVSVSNNKIGSVTVSGTTNYSHGFYGISKQPVAGATTISNNQIGSLTIAKSIQATSTSTSSTAQNVYGIISFGTGATSIANNTIANLYNDYAYQYSTNGQVGGINAINGTNTIQNNTIRDLSTTAESNDPNGNAAVIGIAQKSTSSGQTVSGNTIYNLTSLYTGTRPSSVIGIYYSGGTTAPNIVSNNFIYGFALSSTAPSTNPAIFSGIKLSSGTTNTFNNIINLGNGVTTNCNISGIYENGAAGNNNNLWFNDVYIGGTATGVTPSTYGLYSNANTNTRDFRNNLFYNARTGGTTGKHYAIYLAGTTNLTIDYNDYLATGTNGVLGVLASTDKTSLALWQTATGQDTHSISADPLFALAGGTLAVNYYTAATLTGVSGTGITTDYDGLTRASTPKIGALEINNFTWTGATSSVFNVGSNWTSGTVPNSGANIAFAATPTNDCVLDQDRILGDITNGQSTKKLIVNGKQLTINGSLNFTNGAQIDATAAASKVVFAGTSAQSIPSGGFTSDNIISLTVNNSAGVTQNGNLIISGLLALTNGTLTVGANTLTFSGTSVTATSGNIDASNSGASLVFSNALPITVPSVFSQPVNNLTISGAGGLTASSNFGVNGVLNLLAGNPSTTKGVLDMGSNTLTMGSSGTTTGTGDVTGIVKRTSFLSNTPYTFGNQFTTLNLATGGAFDVSFKIVLSHLNLPGKITINRYYNINTNSSNTSNATKATLNLHYLTTELNGATEGNMDLFDEHNPLGNISIDDHGRSNDNATVGLEDHWVGLGNLSLSYIVNSSSGWDAKYWTLGTSSTGNNHTWLGVHSATSTDWSLSDNWDGGVPVAPDDHVIIPSVTNNNYPILPNSVTLGKLTILSGASLSAGSYTITITGAAGAWENSGTFNAGSGTVEFTNAAATMADPTNFNNVTIKDGAVLTLGYNNIMRIAGTLSLSNTGVLNAASNQNTVEFNGSVQSVINPNGLTPGYSTLILSGSGTKSMPGTALSISKDLTISGSATVTAESNLAITGNLNIGSGSSFTTGAFSHAIGGNLTNSGSFTPTSGSTISLNGSTIQTITGVNTFSNLAVNNVAGVTLASDVTVNSGLILTAGNLNIGANTLGINGALTITAGTITGGSSSNISFGGSGANLTLPAITLNNLTVNRSSGITMGGDVSVGGILALTSGTLTVGTNTLTISGSSPTRTSGTIDASNLAASIIFANPTAITIPASLFSQAVNNLTINGAGGVSSDGNFTINGVLYLPAANASSIKGSLDMNVNTLTMGPEATTTGTGDVTGIVSRSTIAASTTYSFGNQNSTINFGSSGTLPNSISVAISIGTAPSWKSGAILRQYVMTYGGSSPTAKATIRMHYLDGELNSNTDGYLTYWINLPAVADMGRSDYDLVNDVVTISNVTFNFTSGTSFTLANSSKPTFTWTGTTSTDWNVGSNWLGNAVPSTTSDVVIPNTASTNQPSLPSATEIKSINIQAGGVLNAVPGAVLTVNGPSGTWNNDGTFNPGTSTIIFSNGTNATVSGTTNFNNITINSGTLLTSGAGSLIGIAGTVTNNGSWNTTSQGATTVNYNGGSQTVVVPDGSANSYSTLVLSGSGTKTMPAAPLTIGEDFIVSGTAAVVAANPMVITRNTNIGTGSTFTTGSFKHSMSDLTIEQGGTLSISGSGSLIVNGLITNNAGIPGLVIKSVSDAADNTGALFNDNSNVLATVQRWMKGDIWHLVSPTATAVTTPTIADFTTDPGNLVAYAGTVYGLAPYIESDDSWSYYLYTAPAGTFNIPGKGYEILRGPTTADGTGTHGTDGIVSFKGTLTSGNITTPIVKSGNGWNLIGNPYPCALDIKKFLADAGNVSAINSSYIAVYVRDLSTPSHITNGDYTVINNSSPGLDLSSGEGFFVKAAAGGSVNFSTTMKSSVSDAFKSGETGYPDVTLSAQSGTQTLNTSVKYISGMTAGLDPGWDAGLFNGSPSSFSLFTRLVQDNGVDFAIQVLPDNNYENLIVPVGLVASKGSTIHFKATATNLPSNMRVFLEDMVTGTSTRLDDGSVYTVTLGADSQGAGRFYLHTVSFVSAAPTDQINELKVIPLPQNDRIRLVGHITLPAVALVYDMTGRLITEKVLTATDLNDIPLVNAANGVYMLKIDSKKTPVTKKVVWIKN